MAAPSGAVDTSSLVTSLEVAVGHETNRNPKVFIGDFDLLQAGNGSVKRSSQFVGARLSMDIDVPLHSGNAWIGSLELEARRLAALPELNKNRLRLFTGSSLAWSTFETEVLLVLDELRLDDGTFRRHGTGLQGNVIWNTEAARSKVTLDWTRYRHADLDDIYDGDRYTVRYTYRMLPKRSWHPTILARIGGATEINRWGFDDLSSHELLLDLEASTQPTAEWMFLLGLGNRFARFRGPAPGQDFTRHDRRTSWLLAAERRLGESTKVRCEAETIRRNSNDEVARADLRRIGCALEWTL